MGEGCAYDGPGTDAAPVVGQLSGASGRRVGSGDSGRRRVRGDETGRLARRNRRRGNVGCVVRSKRPSGRNALELRTRVHDNVPERSRSGREINDCVGISHVTTSTSLPDHG